MSGVMSLQNVFPPLTAAVRGALGGTSDRAVLADLLFLERWELLPIPGTAAALRVSQIRRANPELAAAVRAEIARGARMPPAQA